MNTVIDISFHRLSIFERRFIFFLYLAVNVLFVIKYSLRVLSVEWVFLVVLVYIIGVSGLFYLINKLRRVHGIMLFFTVSIGIVLLIFAQYSIDPCLLQVDRWSAIHNFLDNLLHGEYPYSARTHLGGYSSPFPVWQLFHFPFYFLGNVGLSIFFIFGLFVYSIYRLTDNKCTLMVGCLMFLSPAFIYEVLVRSDLMANMMLTLLVINYLLSTHKSLNSAFFLVAFVCGLLLSTRLSTVVPIFIWLFGDYMQLSMKKKVLFLLMVFAVFFFTFLPFMLWNIHDLFFFKYNPFTLQTRQRNLIDLFIFIFFAIYWARTWKLSYILLMRNIAYCLLFIVLVTFLHNMWLRDNFNALFTGVYDITYFDMSLPFLVTAVCCEKEKKEYSV
ncbi:hypothetical protein [Hoylesella oralis]|uniref:hypothetical protein n=1 Tax=Hoylesella oralis TaxID=28134 RepID=UPI0028E319A2|nr:hypothetical protein [Hoylesella oralis]